MRLVGEDGGGIDQMVDSVTERLSKFAEKLPILRRLGGMEGVSEDIDNGISGLISELVTRLGDSIPAFALEFVKRTPRAVLTIVVTALACFYFAIDYEGIREGLLSLLGGGAERTASRGLRIVSSALKSYAKAYLLIMLITFAEVFVGLLLLKRKYAFIIAIGIAVVDVLPLFGTGAVLIPWALVSFIIGDHGVATGLLVLYGVITIVRQLIEPKIVGANLGIHPLATLFAMFAGLSLFGFFGMLAGPLVIIVIRELFVMGRENADGKKG
jgi:sporulation integral membrane protein YtvI